GVRPFEGEDEYETVELIAAGVFDDPRQWSNQVGTLEEQILRRAIWPRPLGASASDFGNETARDLADTLEERTNSEKDRSALCDLVFTAQKARRESR
ncbi:MAG: hypothetical protein AAFQ82_15455, partial [Myxococcota bacterium]